MLPRRTRRTRTRRRTSPEFAGPASRLALAPAWHAGFSGERVGYLTDLLRALGMRVLVTDPHAKVEGSGLSQVSMDHLLGESDYVVCLATATPETENLMNAAALAVMKPEAFFVNASRDSLVDEAALVRALDTRKLAGCAMDVGRAPDQMPSMGLARHANVIATPPLAA